MAQIDVYINSGNPSKDPVQLGADDVLVFHNNDSTAHLIELWTKNQTPTYIGIYIAPSPGILALMPDPNDQNSTVYYNVLTPGQKTGAGSGAHGIIIGSGVFKASGEAA